MPTLQNLGKESKKDYFFVAPEVFPATTICRVASVDAEDAALTLRSATSITCFAAFLAVSYAEFADSAATSRADFQAETTASLPAGAFFARPSTKACASSCDCLKCASVTSANSP